MKQVLGKLCHDTLNDDRRGVCMAVARSHTGHYRVMLEIDNNEVWFDEERISSDIDYADSDQDTEFPTYARDMLGKTVRENLTNYAGVATCLVQYFPSNEIYVTVEKVGIEGDILSNSFPLSRVTPPNYQEVK